jgi:DNA processing protein
MCIVSGLARGIDAAAHRGAMTAGGRTLAVLAGGLLQVYPPEHAELAAQISQQGAVLGETPLQSQPRRGAFPRRNRLISGLSLGVVVVEASDRSGALITARHAIEQGREVFAVPGRVDQRNSRGCHRLLRDGAKLVETADDVLEELGPLVESTPDPSGRQLYRPAELQLNDQERSVLDAIRLEPTHVEQVVVRSQLPVQRVLATISVLEMRHLVRRVAGDRVTRLV